MARVLTVLGLIFALVAAYFLISAFGVDTTVQTAYAPEGFDGVANLQLMHIQSMNMLLGACSAIVATLFIIGGEICDRLDSVMNFGPPPQSEPAVAGDRIPAAPDATQGEAIDPSKADQTMSAIAMGLAVLALLALGWAWLYSQ